MNKEILDIVLLSLFVSGIASILSTILGFSISLWLFFRSGRFYNKIINFFRALTGVPTIIFGLLVLLMLSRRGFLGQLNLLFTPTAIIIAQFFLLLPLVITLSSDLLEDDGIKILATCKILHIPENQLKIVFFKESRARFLSILFIAFARGISEVGSVMLVGGNIRGYTRVMTTYIALSTSMGNYNSSLTIALILFLISFTLNLLIKRVR